MRDLDARVVIIPYYVTGDRVVNFVISTDEVWLESDYIRIFKDQSRGGGRFHGIRSIQEALLEKELRFIVWATSWDRDRVDVFLRGCELVGGVEAIWLNSGMPIEFDVEGYIDDREANPE